MQYKLLRNNEEFGPFSKEELVEMKLYPADFIRPDVEGSNWILASRYKELKSKIEENTPVAEEKTSITVITQSNTPTIATNKEQNSASWQHNATEKRIPSPLERPTPSIGNTKPNIPETYNNNKKTAWFKEIILPILVLAGLFAGWLHYSNKKNNTSDNIDALYQNSDTAASTPQDTIASIEHSTPQTSLPPIVNESVAIDTLSASVSPDTLPAQEISPLPEVDTLQKTIKKEEKKDSSKVNKISTQPKKIDSTKKDKTIDKKREVEKNKENATAEKKTISPKNYVNLSLSKSDKEGIQGARITVKNISTTPLDAVTITIRYFDNSYKVIATHTVTVADIAAGKTTNVRIPDNVNASKISYGVSKVSGKDVFFLKK